MKIMLVRPDYAKNYASTIYSSLVQDKPRVTENAAYIRREHDFHVIYASI